MACRFVCSKPPPAGPKPGLSVLTPIYPYVAQLLVPGRSRGPYSATCYMGDWVWGVEFAHVFRARSVVRLSRLRHVTIKLYIDVHYLSVSDSNRQLCELTRAGAVVRVSDSSEGTHA